MKSVLSAYPVRNLRRQHRSSKLHAVALLSLAVASGSAHSQTVPEGPSTGGQIGPARESPEPSGTVNTSGNKPAPASTGLVSDDATADNRPGSKPDGAGDVVVTGSRIVRDGYSAPTPVTVLGAAEIQAQAPANIADFVNTLPSIAGSGTAASSSGSLSNGAAGIDSISLRGLGAGRTLVLIDGQRSVASSVGGLVDINTVPQDLVERVEVVTGGASAQYGSDAVGGVVNFILNKNFKGVELKADNGITTYGDGHNYRFSGSAGLTALDGRLHVLLNAEYFQQQGIDSIDRAYQNRYYFQINNPAYTATNGQPQRLVGSGFGVGTYTAGGLITSGPLSGTYFLGNGQTAKLNFGTFNAVSTPWMIGGDYKITMAGHVSSNSLLPTEERIGVFDRTTFDITPDVHVYAQFSWNRYQGQSFYQQTPSTGVSIKPDNAYLLTYYPAVAAQITAPFTIGTSNDGFPKPGSDNSREVFRYLAGANGAFRLFGYGWKWDAYYQHGVALPHEQLTNTWNVARMALAQDAVIAPAGNAAGIAAGTIVCRSTLTAPTNGCVPIDRLGLHGGPTAAALAYIFGAPPYRDETIKEDVAAASATGEVFKLPGGPAAVAFGAEYRKEQINGYVDPQFQPVFNANGTTTNNWLYGNYLPTRGQYDVKEGFIEVDLPALKGLNINAAGRYTDYSTSGSVQTWKAGATYSPIPDLKLRGTYSHDIRAPNLQELFAAGTARTNAVILPTNSPLGAAGAGANQFVESTIGNPNLKPERANTLTAGIVFTPRIAPGFTASFDYYDIKITDAIGTITSQNTVDFCYSGTTAYCNNIVYTNGALSQIIIKPFNFASQHEKGFDIEASYRTDLSALSEKLPGSVNIHTQITHYIQNIIDNGIFPIDYAGVNGGSLSGTYNSPKWVYRIDAFYTVSAFTFNFVTRGFSAGVYGNDYIQCTSGCPTSTTRYRTINDNHIPGATYFDGSVTTRIRGASKNLELTFVVDNILNKQPPPVGNGPDGNNTPAYVQTNRQLFDVIGRVFRIAARVKF